MERIGQADVITILEKLHQELKAQTRDSKVDQHYLLRKSFHYITATLYKPSQLTQRNSVQGKKLAEVTHRVLQELFALLVGGDGFAPPRIRILCAALVRELSAGDTPYFFRDNFGGNFAQYDHNKVKYFLPVLSELSNSKLLIQNISNLVSWFTGEHDNLGLKMSALSNLIALVQRAPNVLDKDKHIRPMETKFQQILTGASLETRKTTSSVLFGFRIVSTFSSCNVTEVDGTPSRDFFTCMNNSFDYSEDQILNIHIFSSLYYWIFHLYQAQLLEARKKQSREDIISKLEHFGLTRDAAERGAEASEFSGLGSPAPCRQSDGDSGSTQAQARSAESQRLNPVGCFTMNDSFREVVISICLRVLSQVERDIVLENVAQMRLGTKYIVSDLDWIKEFTEATSMEAVRILDLLCLMDPSLVSCIFPAVKKVYERTANRQSGLVFSAVLQFFVNHGQHVIFDVDPVLHHFFVDYVSVRYRRQLLAMSTLLFLTTNTSKMLLHTPVFPKYYPAIIKLLAWHPRTVASEILPLVPAMVGPMTFTELFHTLLDLPLTAAFMEQYDRPEENPEFQCQRFGLDRLSPSFKTVQQYIMRNEAGLGGVCVWETRDEAQLAMIRQLWKSLPVTPRVSSVCKVVPRFLRIYFDVLLTNAPPSCIERVVPLLLQRFASLYPVDFFLNAVHSLIIDTLQAIFQQWPAFLLSLKTEVTNAISAHLDVQGHLLVLHLCWIVGELLSPAMCGKQKGDIVVFFEALEILAYEVISDRAEDPADKKRRTLRGLQGGMKGDVEGQTATAVPTGVEQVKSSVEIAEAHSWGDDAAGGEHDDQGGGNRPDSSDDDMVEGGPKPEHVSEVVFTPRFIAVIIASLTKLGTKFPEFSPRVVLCLLKMRQHYETDMTEGIEFVRDRLTDSLQLLRHSAITNSIYTSQVLPGAEPDRFFSFHLSGQSSLSHMSHNPSTFTPGSLLHDFELPSQPPLVQVASSKPSERWRGDVQKKGNAIAWWEAPLGSGTEPFEERMLDVAQREQPTSGAVDAGEFRISSLDRFVELRRAAAAAVQSSTRATSAEQEAAKRILSDAAAGDGRPAVQPQATEPSAATVPAPSSTGTPTAPDAGATVGDVGTVEASAVAEPPNSSTPVQRSELASPFADRADRPAQSTELPARTTDVQPDSGGSGPTAKAAAEPTTPKSVRVAAGSLQGTPPWERVAGTPARTPTSPTRPSDSPAGSATTSLHSDAARLRISSDTAPRSDAPRLISNDAAPRQAVAGNGQTLAHLVGDRPAAQQSGLGDRARSSVSGAMGSSRHDRHTSPASSSSEGSPSPSERKGSRSGGANNSGGAQSTVGNASSKAAEFGTSTRSKMPKSGEEEHVRKTPSLPTFNTWLPNTTAASNPGSGSGGGASGVAKAEPQEQPILPARDRGSSATAGYPGAASMPMAPAATVPLEGAASPPATTAAAPATAAPVAATAAATPASTGVAASAAAAAASAALAAGVDLSGAATPLAPALVPTFTPDASAAAAVAPRNNETSGSTDDKAAALTSENLAAPPEATKSPAEDSEEEF